MKEFTNILVAITHTHYNSDEFIKAIELALANDAKLSIIAVDDPITRFAEKTMLSKLKVLFTKQLQEVLNDFKDQAEKAKVRSVTTEIRWGKSYIEILKMVQEQGFDLVIKLADPFVNFSRRRLTGDDLHLLRKCPVPVWLIVDNEKHPGKIHKVLVAVDSEFDDPDRVKLNHKLLSYADNISQLEDAELHILQVWSLYGEERLRGPFINMPEDEIDQLLTQTRTENEKALHNLIITQQLERDGVFPHLVKGKASEEIHRIAEELNIDMIVMGTVGRTGLAGFVIGNTAENVLSETSCSVLAVKPDGFKIDKFE
ncbi:universal stress protein [Endozoicomonas sp. SM1973]|uniref:Universal stress protein n=1 Tax=Spartinivicinus marinus TaxID=2994442 RepID=A0A853IC54_9GAMM|nr:universal stress protein [Spartinivicinus marinus]MCX4026869.1 universal stress protein [Spartinivicinus marinus]NYZ66785.1 universal stress protein [Spartinivicinus marinus]